MRSLALSDSALGDLVSSSVVLDSLLAVGPVDLITRENLSEFAQFKPGVRAITRETALGNHYALAVDLTSSSGTRRFMAKLKAERKVGRADGWWARLKAKRVYDEVVPKTPFDHIVRDYEPLPAAFGVPLFPKPKLRAIDVELPSRLPRERYLALHVGAGNPKRVLPETIQAMLIERARGHGWDVILVGTETQAARALEARFPTGVVYEPLTLSQLCLVLKNALVVIGPDSGPVHLAAALGAETVGVYGPNLSVRAGPPPSPTTRFIERDWPCRPCNQNRPCPHQLRCLQSLESADFDLVWR